MYLCIPTLSYSLCPCCSYPSPLLSQKLLFDASKSYEPRDCPKGLEVLFTWRYARPSNGNRDILEIVIGGNLHASLGASLNLFCSVLHCFGSLGLYRMCGMPAAVLMSSDRRVIRVIDLRDVIY